MKRLIILIFYAILTIPSCANSGKSIPKIACKIEPIPGRAILCTKTVSMDFGPADQFIGYSVIKGQDFSIIGRELADSVFSIEIEEKKTFIMNIDEIVSNDNVMSYKSGRDGEVALLIDPGKYIICTQSRQDESTSQPILTCEPAAFNVDRKYQLLLIDNPRAGIQFEWKE
jgi:hypothetical protein